MTFSDTFGVSTTGTGNIDQDPRFVFVDGVPFHLGATSPCRNTANPTALTLVIDPIAVFGVDVFAHDRAMRTRPVGGTRDMGTFEDP